MDSQNNRWLMPLKAIEAEYYSIENLKSIVNILYFAPLRLFRLERSVAPSIFNIKARGLAYCLL